MQERRSLGRGIESLIPPIVVSSSSGEGTGYRMMPIEKLVPNRQQPRTIFDEAKIRELAESIQEEGILQPLIISPLPDGRYELIAGERRFRAARVAGLSEVPVVIKSVDQEDVLVLSILENIQREDLNPIEEAQAFQGLIEQYKYSQDEVAKRMGKSRAAVANSIRLLKLPRAVQDDVANGRYSAGHARALLTLPTLHEQLKLRELIIQSMPTVRDVERLVQKRGADTGTKRKSASLPPQLLMIVEKMKQVLGTKVSLSPGKGEEGKIIIEYYSTQELDRLSRKIIA